MSKFFPSYKKYEMEYVSSFTAAWCSTMCLSASLGENYGWAIAAGLFSIGSLNLGRVYSHYRRMNEPSSLEDIE